MPVATRASAVSFMSFSLTSQPNLFQLVQPMGGVKARPSAPAGAAPDGTTRATRHATSSTRIGCLLTS